MTSDITTPLAIAPDVASRVIEGRAVLVVQDRAMIHSLNESGSMLWEAIGRGSSPRALEALLAEKYDLPPDRAAADVAAFVRRLLSVGALRTEGTSE